jgi:hypothetical protein
MTDQDPQDPNDRVKITIRLPRALVTRAKLHAMDSREDLQDLVQRLLEEGLTRKPPLKDPLLKAFLRGETAKSRKRAASYATKRPRGGR